MAYQLIYTSVKSGLVAGRSGFCTAARHREISEGLVGRIENLSGQYDRGTSATRRGGGLPVIFSHRIVAIRGKEWHLLMRVGDAGSDYSGRTNHIAHTWVFEPEEVAKIPLTPAEVILHLQSQGRWTENYTESAKYFGSGDEFHPVGLGPLVSLPAERWGNMTGSAANAARLMDSSAAMGAGIVAPDGAGNEDFLHLFAESQLLACPDRSKPSALWTRSFTTLMQSAEQRGDFDWYACDYNGPVHLQMLKADRYLIELSKGMAAPQGRYADIAEGRKVEAEERSASRPASGVVAAAVSPSGVAVPSVSDGAALPSATLRPIGELKGGRGRQEKKAGVPVWVFALGGVCLIALLAAVGLLVFGEGKAGGMAGKWEEALRSKSADWTAVSRELEGIPREERDRFRDDPKFRALDDTIKLARKYQWILENHPSEAPEGSGTRDAAAYLKSLAGEAKALEERYRKEDVKMAPLPFLTTLGSQAEGKISKYVGTRDRIAEDWKSLVEGRSEELNFDKLSADERSWFGEEVEVLGRARSHLRDFAKLRDKKYESEEAASAAKKEADRLAGQVNDLLASSEKSPWKSSLIELNSRFAGFKPAMEEKKGPTIEVTETVVAPKAPEKVEDPSTKPLAPVYFRSVTPNGVYDLSAIPELAGDFPKFPYLTPTISYREEDLRAVRAEGLVVNRNLYHEKTKETTVFQVTTGNTLEPTSKMPEAYKRGFLLASSGASAGIPDVLVVAQQASPSLEAALAAPFFLGYPLDKALKNEGGVVTLGEDLAGLLGRFRFPEGSVKFHLLRTQEGKVVSNWPGDDPASLRGELKAGMPARIAAAQAEVERYAALEEVNVKFNEVFGDLGRKLFCNNEGQRLLWQLNEKEVKRGNELWFVLTPESRAADGLSLVETAAAYKIKSAERDPFIEYVNDHLYEVFKNHAYKGGSTFGIADWEDLKRNMNVNATPEEAVEGWKQIAEISRTREWAKMPDSRETRDKNEKSDRINRYGPDRYRSEFFSRWELVFSEDNLKIAKSRLIGGTFDPEVLQAKKDELAKLQDEASSMQEKPLAELGHFYIVVASGGGYFRLVDIR